MTIYDVRKNEADMYFVTREDSNSAFSIRKTKSHEKFIWMLFFHRDGARSNGFYIAEDESKTDLVNRLQSGHYEDLFVHDFVHGEQIYPVAHRNTLLDLETGKEALAPLKVVHWWQKGSGTSIYVKCDIHTEQFSLETMGDTLMEALDNLRSELDFQEE